VDLGAPLFKPDLVHPVIRLEDAAVRSLEVSVCKRIGNVVQVIFFILVLNDSVNSFLSFASATNLNQLGRTETVVVDDRVVQSLSKCKFEEQPVAGKAMRVLDDLQQPNPRAE